MDRQSIIQNSVQNPFANLSGDSISEILSRTSPADTSRFAIISKGCKSVSDLDNVWDKFVPMDIISNSVSPLFYATKKELYLHLCSNPILIDAGKLSFSLDKKTGKKCFMVGARELIISKVERSHGYWSWRSNPDSRFGEVAVLLLTRRWPLDFGGRINTRMLSQKTKYKAYLIFKLSNKINGVASMYSVVRLVNCELYSEAEEIAALVHPHRGFNMHISTMPRKPGHFLVSRDDGWMEIEMGEFYNDQGDDGEVEARLMEISFSLYEDGLIVEGIEFRPSTSVDHKNVINAIWRSTTYP